MSSILFSLPEFYTSYKNWVSQNPQIAGDFESTVKWLSYFIAGRINASNVLSELVYSLSNLLVLFNDRIIQNTRRLGTAGTGEKLKTWLTVLDYSEVFIEVSAKRLWGEKGKWLIVVILQIFKCAGRLLLLFHHKENIIQNPPMPPLQRKKVGEEAARNEESRVRLHSASFTLKRSGRVVRSVSSAPPASCRNWKPLRQPNNNEEDDDIPDRNLSGKVLVAEVLYVIKPVAHLFSMALFGKQDWKPWLLSLFVDLSSLQLYKDPRSPTLSRRQRLELSRRTIALLLYLLRSPFYEHHSRDRLQALLHSLAANLPLAHVLCNPIAQYIPQWQDTYFYMWST